MFVITDCRSSAARDVWIERSLLDELNLKTLCIRTYSLDSMSIVCARILENVVACAILIEYQWTVWTQTNLRRQNVMNVCIIQN